MNNIWTDKPVNTIKTNIPKFEFKIEINGYSFYWNITKLNIIQKLLLKILGIKIKKIGDSNE